MNIPDEVQKKADDLYWDRDKSHGGLGCAEEAYEYVAEWARKEALDGLNELFLGMRDRVCGYMSAPPVSHMFANGGHAFEWAATNVRRAADGDPLLVPPVPIGALRDDDSDQDGWRHYVLTCDTCGGRFVSAAKVRIDHEEFGHYGRIIPDGDAS